VQACIVCYPHHINGYEVADAAVTADKAARRRKLGFAGTEKIWIIVARSVVRRISRAAIMKLM
jgi:hypothetical protein